METQAYLFFEGRCEEAIGFYQKALGAQVEMLIRNNESPEPAPPGTLPPGAENKILHATLRIGDTRVMASDGQCSGKAAFQGFGLSLSPATPTDADRLFNALAAGGKIEMPLGKTFWSPRFGMVRDRFGILWMINTNG